MTEFMTLKEKIFQDFKEAFKAREEIKVSVLRMLNSAIKNREVEKRTKLAKSGTPEAELEKQSQLSDEETAEVVASEVKRRRDSIEQYNQGGRPELAQKEENETTVLNSYLPEQMGEEEIKKLVKETINESGAAGTGDIGKVMKVLMSKVKGKADGNLVNKIMKEELGK